MATTLTFCCARTRRDPESVFDSAIYNFCTFASKLSIMDWRAGACTITTLFKD